MDATQDKDVSKRLSTMYFETMKAKNSLQHLTEQPHFSEIFTQGERGSINALIASSEMRLVILRHLQFEL